MSLFASDQLTQLAFSVHENKGVYALLLGSGLSRAANIPTGWEITLDLIRRVALAQGVGEQPDWAEWYCQETRQEPEYSALVEDAARSPAERRAILNGYIEPTEEDLEEGRKVPTAAHCAIAELVSRGYIRVIVTTNFDRLLENALRERGVEPTVVASVDALQGAEPLVHSPCYVFKLHGDYKDARILNTDAELSGYPPEYDALLDRILDEYGLIVCGWSGEWDDALRAAILRAPNRRYSTYWTTLGDPGDGAGTLINHRRAAVIRIESADAFFKSLQQRVETLEQTRRQNPLSVELLVATTKRFLAKPEYRIQLEDLFAEETSRLINHLKGAELGRPQKRDGPEFKTDVERYEAAAEALACMCGALGRWGAETTRIIVVDVIRMILVRSRTVNDGFTYYSRVRSYPAVLVYVAYGLGLLRAGRWAELYRHFVFVVDERDGERERAVDLLFLSAWEGYNKQSWGQLYAPEPTRTPMNDHVHALFREWSGRFAGMEPDFTLLFERFEILGALAYLESSGKTTVEASMRDPQRGGMYMPVGKIGWDSGNAKKIVDQLQAEPMITDLINAGFARGDREFLEVMIENFKVHARSMGARFF
ncbi:MAG: SIR2 family protein [Rhodospirillales bacterium]|nr:SIR2 family protein [Rhodospirillales bacterium]